MILPLSLQVGRTVEEYFQSTNVPREVQDGFKEFLRMKASKCGPINLIITRELFSLL